MGTDLAIHQLRPLSPLLYLFTFLSVTTISVKNCCWFLSSMCYGEGQLNTKFGLTMTQHKFLIFLGGCFAFANLHATGELPTEVSEAYFDIVKVFQSCPIIYSLLMLLSVISLSIWCVYSMITLRISTMMPTEFVNR